MFLTRPWISSVHILICHVSFIEGKLANYVPGFKRTANNLLSCVIQRAPSKSTGLNISTFMASAYFRSSIHVEAE